MRRIFLACLLGLITCSYLITDASARGFGGGRGFGAMRSKSLFTSRPQARKAPAAASTKQRNTNRWRGALTGLLIGGLISSLFMGHGFAGSLLAWFAVGGILYFIINSLRRKRHNPMQ